MTIHRTGKITLFDVRPPPPLEAASNWGTPHWDSMPPLEINNFVGDRSKHFPRALARLGWDDDAIYAIFSVDDRYVRAVCENHQESVCCDSCVELFFTPGMDVSKGYFNLEINCGGTMLFHFQTIPRKGSVALTEKELSRVDVNRTLPKVVDPEIREPLTWSIEYRVPYEILQPYLEFDLPHVGTQWRANLYKCGDHTSHPHWLTWSPVDRPAPDFHVPESFGILTFAEAC